LTPAKDVLLKVDRHPPVDRWIAAVFVIFDHQDATDPQWNENPFVIFVFLLDLAGALPCVFQHERGD